MAITKLISPSTPNPLPPAGAGGDWDKAMAQLTAVKKLLSGEQMILTQWTNNTTAPALAKGSYLQHLGAIYVVDTEDYALPTISVDGTYYIKLSVSGETLAVTMTTDLTGFSWSSPHNGLYNFAEDQILPYQIVKASAVLTKYRVLNPWNNGTFTVVDYLGTLKTSGGITGASLAVTGAISGASLGVSGAISGASATVNEVSASTKVVLRGREMTYGFLSSARMVKAIETTTGSSATGIAWDGTYYYVLAAGIVYRKDSNFNTIDSLDLVGNIGITWIDGKLITCSFTTIYVYDGYSSTLLTSFASPSSRCSGLTSKNGNLVSVDYGGVRIYEHVGVTSAVAQSIPLMTVLNAVQNTYNIMGVSWTGENYMLIVGEFSIGTYYPEIMAISKDNTYVHDIVSLRPFTIGGAGKVSGLLNRGNILYFCGTEEVAPNYVYNVAIGLKP